MLRPRTEAEYAQAREAMSDDVLLRAARTGDQPAYEELWRRYSLLAIRTVWPLAQGNAEDIVAETFTVVWDQLRRGKGPTTNFRGYVLVVARNICVKNYKDQQRVITNFDFEAEFVHPVVEPVEVASETRQEHREVLAAFRQLPIRWQRVLWLSEVEGVSRPQIAQELDLKPNAVSAMLRRAREGLRIAWLEQLLPPTAESVHPEVVAELPRYLRGALSVKRSENLQYHLTECGSCRNHLDELRREDVRLAKRGGVVTTFVLAMFVGGITLEAAAGGAAPAVAVTHEPAHSFVAAPEHAAPVSPAHQNSVLETSVSAITGPMVSTKLVVASTVLGVSLLTGVGFLLPFLDDSSSAVDSFSHDSAVRAPLQHDTVDAGDSGGQASNGERDTSGDEVDKGESLPPEAPVLMDGGDGPLSTGELLELGEDVGGVGLLPTVGGQAEGPDAGSDVLVSPADSGNGSEVPGAPPVVPAEDVSLTMTPPLGLNGTVPPLLRGWTSPGTAVTVRIGGDTFSVVARDDGTWMIDLAEFSFDPGQHRAQVEADGTTVIHLAEFSLVTPTAELADLPAEHTVDDARPSFMVTFSGVPGASICGHDPERTWGPVVLDSAGNGSTPEFSAWHSDVFTYGYCDGSRLGATVELALE